MANNCIKKVKIIFFNKLLIKIAGIIDYSIYFFLNIIIHKKNHLILFFAERLQKTKEKW